MKKENCKATKGAWIIHHGRKLMCHIHGSGEFPAIDQAAKAATLLTKLGQADETEVSMTEVQAIAKASGVNPHHELTGLLQVLEKKRLIEKSDNQIAVLGVTTGSALVHAVHIYQDAKPASYEQASLNLAEIASDSPVRRSEVFERIGDEHKLSTVDVDEFLNQAETIGFVDKEGDGDDRLLYNGNLFRRDSVTKTHKVLESLIEKEKKLVNEIASQLSQRGCLIYEQVETILSKPLLDKLVAAGIYDLNEVTNEQGSHVYITAPSAFHKFVDPLVDDCFDMAKALVAALMYGMTLRPKSQGKIRMLSALLAKLIRGEEVGPATAIGRDYRVLEIDRVVKLRRSSKDSTQFSMKLLKKEVGELALHVLTQGDAYETSLTRLPASPMGAYIGPEASRTARRKIQSPRSKQNTRDILEAVRGGQLS